MVDEKLSEFEVRLNQAIVWAYENRNNYSKNDKTMSSFSDLYLRYNQLDLNKSVVLSAEQIEKVSALNDVFFAYNSRLSSMLTWSFEYNEWKLCCYMRSDIEACKILFSKIPYLYGLETEGIDEMMESKGRVEGGFSDKEIPGNIPKSHCWWWISP